MEWDVREILKAVGGWGVFTAIAALVAKKMDWIRFGKADAAKVEKVHAEAALDLASVAEKEIEKEVKISNAALQWTVNLSARLEKALAMIDKKQEVIERLYGIIDKMKEDFDSDIEKIKSAYDKRIEDLKKEFDKSKNELLSEREENRKEIKRLKAQIEGR